MVKGRPDTIFLSQYALFFDLYYYFFHSSFPIPLYFQAMASANGWIELVLIEAKDLIAADLRGTSDPYVRVQYGNLKKRTKVRLDIFYS